MRTLSVWEEVTGSSLESFGVRLSGRMAGGLPPLPSTNVGKYCSVFREIRFAIYSKGENESFLLDPGYSFINSK